MEAVIHEATTNGQQSVNASESVTYSALNHQVQQLTVVQNEEQCDTKFSMLPKNQPMHIQFENITYQASEGFRKGTKEILHQIDGVLPSGQLIAIMGPSGAGKSTLLDILSGYRIKGVDGSVYTNGVHRNLKSFRKLSCYITQDDRLQPLLTVNENMHVAADLKLSSNTSWTKKRDIIEEILKTLGLYSTKNTKAGELSGGQKKRLSIALELINNPLVLFLDEPTTGLDSSSCSQCVKLLKVLARQGRTIVCTIHQPSASLFQLFDLVYVLAEGRCLYQGTTEKLVTFFENVGFPCPMYHNPADYVIELACGEYGDDKVKSMITATKNGKSHDYFEKPDQLHNITAINNGPCDLDTNEEGGLHATSPLNQLKVLLRRGVVKTKRDQTLTYMRICVNVCVGLMLGTLYLNAGVDGSKVIDNYNLLFSILMHHMMSTMMLTILTFPSEMTILVKEHFNRWYSLKMYYTSVTLLDIPLSTVCCFIFTVIVYFMTAQPYTHERFMMFFVTSLLVVFVAQSVGLAVGAYFSVVNGTFLGPVISVPVMMFAGFGVSLKDLPYYLYWGSYVSYLRYGLEGVVGAVYGLERPMLDCPEDTYCHYKYPKKFLEDVAVKADQFYNDVIALLIILFVLRIAAFVLLRYKLQSLR